MIDACAVKAQAKTRSPKYAEIVTERDKQSKETIFRPRLIGLFPGILQPSLSQGNSRVLCLSHSTLWRRKLDPGRNLTQPSREVSGRAREENPQASKVSLRPRNPDWTRLAHNEGKAPFAETTLPRKAPVKEQRQYCH